MQISNNLYNQVVPRPDWWRGWRCWVLNRSRFQTALGSRSDLAPWKEDRRPCSLEKEREAWHKSGSYLEASLKPESGMSRPLPMMLEIITLRDARWIIWPICQLHTLTLVCFFIATSNMDLASLDMAALSLEFSFTFSMAWHHAEASGWDARMLSTRPRRYLQFGDNL